MHDQGPEDRVARSLHSGLRVSAASVIWTVAAGAGAVALGVAKDSLVLVAFGAIGLVDGAGSMTLVEHFRHAIHREAISERRERLALRVVTIGMVAVALGTIAQSAHRLVADGGRAEVVPAGIALAGASLLVLSTLAVLKRRIARLIPSHALHADGWLSATGAMLALITMIGTVLNGAFHVWWLDPIAAMAVALAAIGLAIALAAVEGR